VGIAGGAEAAGSSPETAEEISPSIRRREYNFME